MNTLQRLLKKTDEIAIIERGEYRRKELSYNELFVLCRKFVQYYRDKGVKRGDRVIIWANNSVEYISAVLGGLMEGIIIVPIDMRSNIDFVKKIVKETNARLVIQTVYKPSVRGSVFLERIILDKEAKGWNNVKADDIALIMYTSGTTGRPKGVILTHNNLCANVNALSKAEKIDSSWRILMVLPFSHIFAQMIGLFVPLRNKASVVLTYSLKGSVLFEVLKEEGVTHLAAVPRLLEILKSKIERFGWVKQRLIGGRMPVILCGGAMLSLEIEQYFRGIGVKIMQGYGLTESSPVLTINTEQKIGSVGKALRGVKLKIKNDEVYAKGESITKGYYKNTAETRKLFDKGWMRTGDMGFFKDEYLYLKGRKKDVIVTSEGINVYPEDIEGVLNKIEGVEESAVVEKDGEVAAVLITKRKPEKIMLLANKQLDQAQKIKHVFVMKDFPRTATGKPKKYLIREGLGKKVTEQKKKVHNVVSQVAHKSVKDNDTLESLGLSSADIIELVSLLEQEYSTEIDETKINPNTKVKDLERLLNIKPKYLFKEWSLNYFVRLIGIVMQIVLVWPLMFLFCRPKFTGEMVKGPVIYAANHQSYFDAAVLMMKFRNVAVAAWQEFFYRDEKYRSFVRRVMYYLSVIVFNIYPLPQTAGFRKSVQYTGRLIDKGWNVLLFPEGMRTRDGKMNDFKVGVGMMAVEMGVPVVPVKIEGLYEVLPYGKFWPRFGRVKVRIGKPMKFSDETYLEATKKIEKAVERL